MLMTKYEFPVIARNMISYEVRNVVVIHRLDFVVCIGAKVSTNLSTSRTNRINSDYVL